MQREDILAKSREENRFGDERRQEIHRKAQSFSLMVTSAVCSILILSSIWSGEDASDVTAVLLASLGAYMGWRGFAERDRVSIVTALFSLGAMAYCLARSFFAVL